MTEEVVPIRLLINADDFGLSTGVNYGIQEAFQKGIVRSASLLPTGREFSHALGIVRQNPDLGVGVHLTLTHGRPVGPKPDTLVDADGNFLGRDALLKQCRQLDPRQIEREFQAQIQKVMDHGIRPTHLDTHHNIHWTQPVLTVFLRLAAAFRLPVCLVGCNEVPVAFRALPGPQLLDRSFHGEQATLQHLLEVIDSYKTNDSVVEVVTHPGYVDSGLFQDSTYHTFREMELRVLLSGELRRLIARNGVTLIGYQQLSARTPAKVGQVSH